MSGGAPGATGAAPDAAEAELRFPTPPAASLWASFTKRGRWQGRIPRIRAAADRIPTDAGAYARVCGFPVADPLPVTWPAVATTGLQVAVLTSAAFPLPVLGIVHARQRITRHRHLRPGEALSAACVVEGHRVTRTGGEFDLAVTVRAGDAVAWEGVSTILSTRIRGTGGPRGEPPPEPAWRITRSTVWRLPADQGRRYAAVSGDYNPIHLWPATARLFGFSRPIAHGWWALARALAELDTDLPEACTVEARFVGPMPLPGTLTFSSGPAAGGGLRFQVAGRKPCIVGEIR